MLWTTILWPFRLSLALSGPNMGWVDIANTFMGRFFLRIFAG